MYLQSEARSMQVVVVVEHIIFSSCFCVEILQYIFLANFVDEQSYGLASRLPTVVAETCSLLLCSSALQAMCARIVSLQLEFVWST